MSDNTIVCRARQSKSCYHGRAIAGVYPDGMEDDGTWNGESVVCDPCYIKGGQPALPVVDERRPPYEIVTREQVVEHVDREMGIKPR